MSQGDTTPATERYVVQRCPECHGQVGHLQGSVWHRSGCPNMARMFVVQEIEVVPAAEVERLETEIARLRRAFDNPMTGGPYA